jgi:hypothetical protein
VARYTYDAQGRRIRKETAGGGALDFVYDASDMSDDGNLGKKGAR